MIKQFQELCKKVPELKNLENEIRALKRHKGFCANRVWFGYRVCPSFKKQMSELVGYFSENPEVRNCESFDIAYKFLYDLLPACRHSGGCY